MRSQGDIGREGSGRGSIVRVIGYDAGDRNVSTRPCAVYGGAQKQAKQEKVVVKRNRISG